MKKDIMKTEVNMSCVICNSVTSKLLIETKFPIFNYPGIFKIRKCDGCGLLFNSPRITDEEIYKLYNNNYYFFESYEFDEFPRITNLYLRTIALIQNELKEKNVVEIGSGKGYLLSLMKNLGWNIQGIEISSEASIYAVSSLNIPTFKGTIVDFNKEFHNTRFPLVLVLDVIEHIPDPIIFLKNVDKILANGGLLIVDTPNGDAKNIEYLGRKWPAFNPFHIYFFSISNLQLLLTRMGYTIEKSFTYNNVIRKMKLVWDFKHILQKVGLFKIIKSGYRLVVDRGKKQKDIKFLINNAIEVVQKKINYLETDDLTVELAESKRGDNIIIIARKN